MRFAAPEGAGAKRVASGKVTGALGRSPRNDTCQPSTPTSVVQQTEVCWHPYVSSPGFSLRLRRFPFRGRSPRNDTCQPSTPTSVVQQTEVCWHPCVSSPGFSRRLRRLSFSRLKSAGTHTFRSTRGSGRSRERQNHGCPWTKSKERHVSAFDSDVGRSAY